MSTLSSRRRSGDISPILQSLCHDDDLPLSSVLDDQLIQDALDDHQVDFGNAPQDVYTPMITLWAMISQVLHRGPARSVKAAAGRVVTLLAQRHDQLVACNPANYCRAKAKIPVAALQQMTRRLADRALERIKQLDPIDQPPPEDTMETRHSPEVIDAVRKRPIAGRFLMADGWTVDAADTAANQAAYPQNPSQKDGLGFPLVRCVGLFCMITGVLADMACGPYSGKGSGEQSLMRQLLGHLRPGDVLVADCYYCTYFMIVAALQAGATIVMKNHHRRSNNPLGALRYSKDHRRATWLLPDQPDWMSDDEYAQMPGAVMIQLIDIKVVQKGFRVKSYTVATTVGGIDQETKDWLAAVYRGRWYVEKDIESIKCTMGIEHLRSLSPEGLLSELWTGLLTYNLVRLKMLDSSVHHGREHRSLSFTDTYQMLSTNWLVGAIVEPSVWMRQAMLDQPVGEIVGNRPDRVEPRANKRRPKVLELLTVSRRQWRQQRSLAA